MTSECHCVQAYPSPHWVIMQISYCQHCLIWERSISIHQSGTVSNFKWEPQLRLESPVFVSFGTTTTCLQHKRFLFFCVNASWLACRSNCVASSWGLFKVSNSISRCSTTTHVRPFTRPSCQKFCSSVPPSLWTWLDSTSYDDRTDSTLAFEETRCISVASVKFVQLLALNGH